MDQLILVVGIIAMGAICYQAGRQSVLGEQERRDHTFARTHSCDANDWPWTDRYADLNNADDIAYLHTHGDAT